MNRSDDPRHLGWGLWQSFSAVAELGSLSAAARSMQTSQPTLSRHITQLEKTLNLRLFERTATGLELTGAGLELSELVRAMADSANQLALAATGHSERIEGTIRITASLMFATSILPPILCDLRKQQPQIDIEIVASDRSENLLKREADIAIRMYRPTQADVISKRIADYPIGMFATKDYLDAHGRPDKPEDLFEHEIIGLDSIEDYIKGFRQSGLKIDHRFFSLRCDAIPVGWEMVKAGYGIGLGHIAHGKREPALEQLLGGQAVTVLPIWLTTHAEVKTNRRIRYVYDFLGKAISDALG